MRIARIGMFSSGCLAFIIGFILGIAALFGMRRRGRSGILGRAITGVIVNGVLILISGLITYALIADARKAHSSPLPPIRERMQRVKRDIVYTGNLRNYIETNAQHWQGNTGLVLQALSAVLGKETNLMENCYVAVEPLAGHRMLDMLGVTNVEQLEQRKFLVRKFLDANNQLSTFQDNLVEEYKNEMKKRDISSDVVVVESEQMTKKMASMDSRVNRIYELNRSWAQGELESLDLLEQNWDKWEYDPEKGKILFEDNSLLPRLNKLLGQINAADKERKRLQQELWNAQKH